MNLRPGRTDGDARVVHAEADCHRDCGRTSVECVAGLHVVEFQRHGIDVDCTDLGDAAVGQTVAQLHLQCRGTCDVSDCRRIARAEVGVLPLFSAVIDLALNGERRAAASRLQLNLHAGRAVDARASLVGRGDDDEQIARRPTSVADLRGDVGVGGVAFFDVEVVLGDVCAADARRVAAVGVVAHFFEHGSFVVNTHRERCPCAADRDLFACGDCLVHGEIVVHSARCGGGRRIRELERHSAHRLICARRICGVVSIRIEDCSARRRLTVDGIAAGVECAVEDGRLRPYAVGRSGSDVKRRLQDVERQRRALPFGHYDVICGVEVGVRRRHLSLFVYRLISRAESIGARVHRVGVAHLGRTVLIQPGICARLRGNRLARRGQGQRGCVDGVAVIHHRGEVPAALLIGDAVLRHRTEDDFERRLLRIGNHIDHRADSARMILHRRLRRRRVHIGLALFYRPNEFAGIAGGQCLEYVPVRLVFERSVRFRTFKVGRDRLYAELTVLDFDFHPVACVSAGGIDLRPVFDVSGVAYARLFVSVSQAVKQAVIVVRQRDRQSALMLRGVDQSAGLEVVVLRRIVRFGAGAAVVSLLVVIVVVVALRTRPRDDDALNLRVDVADAVRRRVDHVSVVGLTVAVFELAAGDAARKRVVALACAVVVAAAYDRGDRTGAGQIAVLQLAAVADEEADHTARDGDAVSPSGKGGCASASVRKRADRDAVAEVDICIADRTAYQNSCERTCDCGVFPRSGIAVYGIAFRIDLASLLSADKVVRHIDSDIIDCAEVGARDDAVSGDVLRLVAGKKRHSSGDARAVYNCGHSHV